MEHRWSIAHRVSGGAHEFEYLDKDQPTPDGTEIIWVYPYLDPAGYYLIKLAFPMSEVTGVPPSRPALQFLRSKFRYEVKKELGEQVEVAIYVAFYGESYYIRDGKGCYEDITKLMVRKYKHQNSGARTKEEQLPPNQYRVRLSYSLPAEDELRKRFDEVINGFLFDGSQNWERHASCVGMDETPGDKTFLLKCFGEIMKSEDIIAWGLGHGYRPATHIEAIEFAEAYPEVQLEAPVFLIALGSFTTHHDYKWSGDRKIVVLSQLQGARVLGTYGFDDGFNDDDRFLFVRKETKEK